MLNLLKNRNESGFTLVEILIGIGLLGVLAAIASSLLYYTAKQQQRTQHRGEVFEFQQNLQYKLRSQPIPDPTP